MSITGRILEDHAQRKDASGVAWFDAGDLARLGISDPVMTVMQNVQHVLRSGQSRFVVETLGCLDRFTIHETHGG